MTSKSVLKVRRLSGNGSIQFHLKILQTNTRSKIGQKTERRRGVQRREGGVVQAFQPHFITENDWKT